MNEAKAILEQAIESWNAGDRDRWATLYADDVVYTAPGDQRISGLANLKEQYFEALLTAAPDRRSRDVVLFADGDYVVEHARYTGTHTGPLRTADGAEIPPTGRTFEFPFVGIFRVEGGKICSVEIYYDQFDLFMQLGLLPGTASN